MDNIKPVLDTVKGFQLAVENKRNNFSLYYARPVYGHLELGSGCLWTILFNFYGYIYIHTYTLTTTTTTTTNNNNNNKTIKLMHVHAF